MRAINSLGILLLALSVCRGAWGVIPSGKDLPTQAQYDQRHLALLKKWGSDIYRVSGHHDPRWDDDAIRFLDACDALDSSLPYGACEEELLATGAKLTGMGCNDPLVAYQYGRLIHTLTFKDPRAPLTRAWSDLGKFGYPALRQLASFKRISMAYKGQGNEADRAINDVAMRLPELLNAPEMKQDREFLIEALTDTIEGLRPTDAKRVYDTVNSVPGVDPLVLKTVEAIYHEKSAWISRTQQEFDQHAAKAGELFTTAWTADPTSPEVARYMITLSMRRGDAQAMRLWFDRAVKARFDYWPAYRAMLTGLSPQWLGSRDQMLAFGRECAQTKRYDTVVPFVLVWAMLDSLGSSNGDPGIWNEDGLYPLAAQVLTQMAQEPRFKDKADYFRTLHAAIAARLGNWQDAAKLMNEMGDHADDRIAKLVGYRVYGLRGRALAFAGATAELVTLAQKRFSEGDLASATKLFEQALAVPQDDPAATWFIKSAAKACQWQAQFEAGQTVSLDPDADLAGWEMDQGDWTIQDKWISGHAPNSELRLTCLAPLGPKWELLADIEFKNGGEPWSRGGILISQNYGWNYRTCEVCPGWKQVTVGGHRNRDLDKSWPLDVDGPLHLVVRRDDGRVNVSVNGREVFAAQAFAFYQPAAVERVALGSDRVDDRTIIRFSNVQIRKIDRLGTPTPVVALAPPKTPVPPAPAVTDPNLRALETAGAATARKRVDLAEAWWKYAQTQTGQAMQRAKIRAGVWYHMALPDLKGDEKDRVAKRLGEVPENVAWESMLDKLKAGSSKTGNIGGNGGGPFQDSPDTVGLLVGLDVCKGDYSGHPIIKAIRPLYLTPEGRLEGKWQGVAGNDVTRIESHPGYAVGGLIAKGGDRLDGLRLIFMRIQGDSLDKRDAYESAWVGGEGGGEMVLGNGQPAVGVYGRKGEDVDCVGLIQIGK